MKFSVQLLVLLCAVMIGVLVFEAEAGKFGRAAERALGGRRFEVCQDLDPTDEDCRGCCAELHWGHSTKGMSATTGKPYCVCYSPNRNAKYPKEV